MAGRATQFLNGTACQSLGMQPEHPSWALGILGMPGFTAYMGLSGHWSA